MSGPTVVSEPETFRLVHLVTGAHPLTACCGKRLDLADTITYESRYVTCGVPAVAANRPGVPFPGHGVTLPPGFTYEPIAKETTRGVPFGDWTYDAVASLAEAGLGRIVQYRVTAQDVMSMGDAQSDRIGQRRAQVRLPAAGEYVPAMVVATRPSTDAQVASVNLRLFLDGLLEWHVARVELGYRPGQWRYPPRV